MVSIIFLFYIIMSIYLIKGGNKKVNKMILNKIKSLHSCWIFLLRHLILKFEFEFENA
jgi:hypothetical protein